MNRKILQAIVMLIFVLKLSIVQQAKADSFLTNGMMTAARWFHTATLLPNGNVLVAGGLTNQQYLSSAELFNPVTGTWNATNPMNSSLGQQTATLLPNGRVLVAGGDYNGGYIVSDTELFDPATGTWTNTGYMTTAVVEQTATLLPDGKVLAAGGVNWLGYPQNAELYDPVTGTWTNTGAMITPRAFHTATLLLNGKVLVAGGAPDRGFSYLSSAELYDPATGTWTATGTMSTVRYGNSSTLLPNGMVLVVGGNGSNGFALSSAELYDQSTGTWTNTGSLNIGRSRHTATLLPNGQVLVVGGEPSGIAELYNPSTGTWATNGALNTPRYSCTATLLPNGQVLIAGGLGNTGTTLASTELYNDPLMFFPDIINQPQNQYIQIGSNVTISITASGFQPLYYQWLFDGNFLAGQTNVNLLLNNVQLTNGGNYSVTIANAYGSTNSAIAQLTVYTNLVLVQTNRTPQTTEIGSPTIPTDTNHFKVYVNGNFVSGAALNPNKMTVVLTHGWNGSLSDWAEYMAQIIWKRIGSNAVNIVAWDWSGEDHSDWEHMTDIAAETPGEGVALGTNLVAALGANYSQRIHFIGHSMGTLVNAAAANYVHSHGFSWTNTQMTLCDDAEIAWGIGANGGWQFTTTLPQSLFRLIPNTSTSEPYWGQALPNHFAWADNYISAVGLIHTNAANAILSYTYPGIVGDINTLLSEFDNFHDYSHFFYEDTIEPGIFNNGGQTNATYLGFINSWEGGGFGSRQAANTYFYQDPNGLELNLAPIDSVTANTMLNARLGNFLSIGVSSAEDASPWYWLGINSAEAVGQVTGINSTVGLAINLLTTFGGGTSQIQSLNVRPMGGAVPKVGSAANTPAYAWIPLNVPADAVSMSFDFMLQGNGNQDSFQAALNGTNILSLETSLIQTNVTVNSGLINVSQYAGQQVELFLGIVGGTSTNEALTANNFQFYSILPPSLQIQMARTNVVLTWPLSGSGYVLQTTDNLTPPVTWTPVASASSIVNYQCTATAQVFEASRFYRLAPPSIGSPALQVTINPATAASAGALWQVDGGAWQSSGDKVAGLTAGNHTVTFNTINNWNSPASQIVTVNNSSATASGTFVQQPGSLQVTITPAGAISAGALWQVDGGAWQLSGTTVSSLTVGNHTVAFSPLGGWTNPASQIAAINANQLTTANGNYVLIPDATKPTTQITTPTAGLSVSNASYTITGKAGDNVYVAGVWYQLNGAGWNLATTGNGWTNWTVAAALIPMTNIVKAFTVDAAGNVSATNSVSFICILNTPLTVSTNGLGSISPNDNGALLTVGKSYSVAATASTGFVFSNWTGGINLPSTILTNGATLKFLMQSNLWLQANFRETAKPTLTVTSPKTGTKQTNAVVNIVGTAKDDWTIAGVWCQVNGGALTPAITSNKFTNWTAQVTLITGANTVKTFAQNGGGIYSTTNSLSLTH
jgi:pimeloyl-ACP methyl ester carboxylesterase